MSRKFFRRTAPNLADLASRSETGVLTFSNGAVHLVEGMVCRVVSEGVRSGTSLDLAADAALEIVTEGAVDRFVPGSAALSGWVLSVPALLDEVARRGRVLALLSGQARPDSPVSRASSLPTRRVRLLPRQWELVRLADGSTTPRFMAAALERGVFATTVDVATLVSAGLFEPLTPDANPIMPFLEAVS